MLAGFSGSLVSEFFAESILASDFAGELGSAGVQDARQRLVAWQRSSSRHLGPVCGARAVHDLAGIPLAVALGFDPPASTVAVEADLVVSRLAPPDEGVALVSVAWARPLDASWRAARRAILAAGAPWCLCTNGRTLRLADTRRLVTPSFVEFDIEAALQDDACFAVLWALLRREAFEHPPLVERVARASHRHAEAVCASLRRGVLVALSELLGGLLAVRGPRARRTPPIDVVHEQALTIVYRVLFLLFAESRGLVPTWHRVYRESYSMEALCELAERPGPADGLWETLQAMCRLAHAGCRAGGLRVTPFNGRLFAPSATPLAERTSVGDERARRLVLALSTVPSRRGRSGGRVVYRDLGVEQLGAVYEGVLDFRPRFDERRPGSVTLVPGGNARKATGTFYTPRAITSALVARTLAPLVAGASPDRVLSLRVVDPAMGSGAFLVAACRFLADAYERALLEEAGCHASDITDADRRGFRRLVAQRCLFGVDRNPMAVQLARLSLWLCTMVPDRPLTFLDHRLAVGDSLVGASLDDLRRAPPGAAPGASVRAARDCPLFETGEENLAVQAVLPARLRLALAPDDSLAAVRDKELTVASLGGPGSPLGRWKQLADLWCGSVYPGGVTEAGVFFAAADAVFRGASALPGTAVERLLQHARETSADRRFFHWPLEFPEVFFDASGRSRADAGFDAVLGNPPWEMVRDDDGGPGREDGRCQLRFVRASGLYRHQGGGHANLYQLFVERAIRLTREGGRLGLVVPWGLASDAGSEGLRRLLFDRCTIEAVAGFENSRGIFPIHRGTRFVLLTASTGGRTDSFECRLGLRDPGELDPGSRADHSPIVVSRRLLERVSAADVALPDLRGPEDLALLEKLVETVPSLGSGRGWGAAFGRELNASDDARHFVVGQEGLPIVEGKHVAPFQVAVPAGGRVLPTEAASRLLDPKRTWGRARLAYREVASATNRLTLIAAVVPAGCVTVHTLFCLKTPLGSRDLSFLCGTLNSFVANYLVRLRVVTHVTAGIVAWLPVPRLARGSACLETIASLSSSLQKSAAPAASPAYPRLQAAVARAYGLTEVELRHVLATFPLVDAGVKSATLLEFGRCAGFDD